MIILRNKELKFKEPDVNGRPLRFKNKENEDNSNEPSTERIQSDDNRSLDSSETWNNTEGE